MVTDEPRIGDRVNVRYYCADRCYHHGIQYAVGEVLRIEVIGGRKIYKLNMWIDAPAPYRGPVELSALYPEMVSGAERGR